MEKDLLVKRLREKKRFLGGPDSQPKVEAMTDSEVINSYVTCPECGGLLATEQQVEAIITEAQSAEEFLVLTLLDVERHGHETAIIA